ncbi:PDZ domain-containing protein [Phenylobacterium sp.]|uniref:S41 family peptidase n=1 Tax=Phenylobacterium sp. TaxID=1871053 RepID=UPI0035B3C713
MRLNLLHRLASASVLVLAAAGAAQAAPQILQQPALSRDLIAFTYGGDIWTVPRAGGRATRLTTGVGSESGPMFSPDGATIAFTGDYDGNIDVFTVPVTGGVPKRLTWHPGADVATGWSPDGAKVLFRSDRTAASRYTQMFQAPAAGGQATPLPLPMAYAGQLSADGGMIAYNPLAPASGFELNRYVSWGNYRGGRASTIWLTSLPGLDSVQVPHAEAADFSPVFLAGKVYFLSNRNGPASVFSYDPANRQVAEVYRNTGPEIRTLATDGQALIFDRLGELFLLEPGGGEPRPVSVTVAGDMPDVRPRILNVAGEVQKVAVSPTGLRVAVEAHGEILTAPAKNGPVRNLTNTPGVMEREPAWSPDGQSIAYFSDESGRYALHVAPQAGEGQVRKFPLVAEPAYFFDPLWSPDSRKIAFYDNRLRSYVLDLATGKLTTVGEPGTYGGFSNTSSSMAWSPDSRWLAFPRSMPNRLNALFLWSADRGTVTQVTDPMADARQPAFDRSGKQLYFLGSNNAGPTVYGLDMTSNLYTPTRSIYALTLKGDTLSPVAPQIDDEKSPAEAKAADEADADATPAGQAGEAKAARKARPKGAARPVAAKAIEVDLEGRPLAEITKRTVALPIPARAYSVLSAGKPGVIYFQEQVGEGENGAPPDLVLNRFTLEDRKVEKLAERVASYELTADGEKILLGTRAPAPPGGAAPGAPRKPPSYAIVAANAPPKAGDGALSLDALEVRVDPPAEWAQMYREVWRIQRAYFYDPGFHGLDIDAAEKRLAPYAAGVLSRSDLNYVFQEGLTGLSVGHLRGFGGAVPSARRVPGGLLGADYVIRDGRWCVSKIYTGGAWSPDAVAPLAQPGLNVREGECILAIDGKPLPAATDIQLPLEGTAGRVITLRVGPANGQGARNVNVVPVASEYRLRNLDWIDSNRRKVDQLSGGKLAYVYLPDTGEGGFTAFNRYYFAQTDKQGAVIDERFNGGGQMADYIVEVLGRRLQSWWAPRYGAIERTPAHAILGPKVMIANEVSGSGGDALPWMFKQNRIGPLVGKRTWGGLVGIGQTPVLMDGAQVTSPSVGFFNPKGEWEVENYGVAPDHVVEQDPKAVAQGHDPQLEAAVALAMEALKKEPAPTPRRPAYPVYPLKPAAP